MEFLVSYHFLLVQLQMVALEESFLLLVVQQAALQEQSNYQLDQVMRPQVDKSLSQLEHLLMQAVLVVLLN